MTQYNTKTLALSFALIGFGAPTIYAQSNKDQAPTTTARHLASWTADRKDYAVGDVITVLVTEATLATATKSQSGTDQQSRANDMDIEPPKIGTTSLPSLAATMGMNKKSSSSQAGDAKRGVNFKGDISVRVVAIDKNGQVQIKGTKVVDVDKNKQTLDFSGWIRPQDVTLDNIVSSDRVADASLQYSLSGDLGKTRGGIIGRILNVFWP
jgi:flagellar L-ring protein precursor FlgH